jgi:hypothetical protein
LQRVRVGHGARCVIVVEIYLARAAASNCADVSLAGLADDILGDVSSVLIPDVNWDAIDVTK